MLSLVSAGIGLLTALPELLDDDSNWRYGLRYQEFIAPLVKAVQELSQEVAELKARVAELEGNVNP